MVLLKTYHEVAHPVVLLRNLRPSLKPRARIGIIDRNGNGKNHGVNKDVVVREAAQALPLGRCYVANYESSTPGSQGYGHHDPAQQLNNDDSSS